MSKRSKDNSSAIGVALAIGAVATIGTVALVRSKSADKQSQTKSGSSSTSSPSLTEVATAIREATLVVNGCTVGWQIGEASRTELLGHHGDFFVPAIADARAKGQRSVDEITAHVTALLVPGCTWPPIVLREFDLEQALSNQLTFIQKQAWTIAQTVGSVRLYLTVRQVVAALATQSGGF